MPTSTYGVRYPAPTDPADVATDLNELATDVDGVLGTIPVLTTKGDMITRTATAPARLGVGADGTYLLADSTQATGLRWGTPTIAADPFVLIAEDRKTSGSSTSFSFTGISQGYTDLFLRVSASFASGTGSPAPVILACNGTDVLLSQCVLGAAGGWLRGTSSTSLLLGTGDTATAPVDFGFIEYRIGNYSLTSMFKPVYVDGNNAKSGTAESAYGIGGGTYRATTAVSSITLREASNAVIRPNSYAQLFGLKRFGQ